MGGLIQETTFTQQYGGCSICSGSGQFGTDYFNCNETILISSDMPREYPSH